MKIMKTKLWSMILSLLCVIGMSVESGWGMTRIETLRKDLETTTGQDTVALNDIKVAINGWINAKSNEQEEKRNNLIKKIEKTQLKTAKNYLDLFIKVQKSSLDLEMLRKELDSTNGQDTIALNDIKVAINGWINAKPNEQEAKRNNLIKKIEKTQLKTAKNYLDLLIKVKKESAAPIIAKQTQTTQDGQQTSGKQTGATGDDSGATIDLGDGQPISIDAYKQKIEAYVANPSSTEGNPVLKALAAAAKDNYSKGPKGRLILETLAQLKDNSPESIFGKLVTIPIKNKDGVAIKALAEQDERGRTVLHYAAEAGDVELVKQIIEAAKNLG